MALNQSKIKMWRRCQKQFAFRYDYADEGQEMIPKVSNQALTRGSWMHLLQQVHHTLWAGKDVATITVPNPKGRGQITVDIDSWEEAHAMMSLHYHTLFEEERDMLGDLPDECDRLFKAYLSYYKDDDQRYKPLVVDGEVAAEMILEVPLTKWGIDEPFKGTVDLLVEDLEYGGIWVWDAKWVKKVPPAEERMMSPQALLYVWALRRLGYDIRGFVFNYGRTKAPAIPRVLKKPAGMLSMRANMDTNYETYLECIKETHGKRWEEYAKHYYADHLDRLKNKEVLWFRRERIPTETDRIKQALGEFIYSARQIKGRGRGKYVPRSYFYSCKFNCEFHDLCVAEFNGLDIEPLIKHGFQITGERYEQEDLLNA